LLALVAGLRPGRQREKYGPAFVGASLLAILIHCSTIDRQQAGSYREAAAISIE
jgi:hypothetical protein